MKKLRFLSLLFLFIYISFKAEGQNKEYIFENVGEPIKSGVSIEFLTRDSVNGDLGWAALTDAEKNQLIGVDINSGKIRVVDFKQYGKSNSLLIFKKSNRFIYVFAGRPGRFFIYDIIQNQLREIGEHSNALYWMKKSYTISPVDSVIYIGTYPQSSVSIIDTKNNKVKHLRNVSSSDGAEYVINPASNEDGIIFFPIGMKKGELWSYNPRTEVKKQILPRELMTYGQPNIWRGKDGNVYGRKGNTSFLCLEDKIIKQKSLSVLKETNENIVQDKIVLGLDKEGYLCFRDILTGEDSFLKTDFEPIKHTLFSIGDVFKDKLYGSGMKPGDIFSYDLKSGEFENYGVLTRGRIQTYDIIRYQDKLITSSYVGGNVDVFECSESGKPINRYSVTKLSAKYKQERILELVKGEKGNVYGPTVPIKGHLGGGLLKFNPLTKKVVFYKDIIQNQSLMSVTFIEKTGQLFLTSSIRGGSSSKPIEKEAYVAIWDPITQKIIYKDKIIKGTTVYGKSVIGADGLIYGTAKDSVFIFNPINKEVIKKMSFEKRLKKKPSLMLSENLSKDSLIYGIDTRNGVLFKIDRDYKLRILTQDPTLVNSRFAKIIEDGFLYYQNKASLKRVKL